MSHQHQVKEPHVKHRVGEWLPKDHRIVEQWVARLLQKLERDGSIAPSYRRVQELIDDDSALRMGFTQMFD